MAYGLSTALSGADCYLGRLDELKKDGISHLELCLREDYGGQAALYEGALAAIQAAGLTGFSVHLPFGMSVSPACTKQAQRQKNVEKLKRFISLTKGCGAEIFVIHASFEPVEDAAREAMLDSAAQSLRELVDYMEPQGLTLALENLPRTCIGNSAREIAYLTGCVPELRLCLDTNHFTSPHPDVRFRPLQRLFPSLRAKWNSEAEGGVSYAQRFAEQIVTVHISDYDGIDECHWLPGQGIVDFKGIHTALAGAGFDAPIVFEPNERCRGIRTTGARLIGGYEKRQSRA